MSISPFRVLAVPSASLLATALALADGNAPTGNHVVVTATRVPTPIDEVLAPVIVIDRAAIERSVAGDATDLLRFHAGLDLAAMAAPDRRRPSSSAAPRAITRWSSSTACASTRARSGSRRCRTSRLH